ncbi:hydrogenase accessory protein [Rhizobium sp. SEMIA 4085]|uniref:Hydrogenase expression/formation protein n=1 Tax=Rhizobium gallicum bv. gallicum R602sp TaxID=1041138 RepID=A0A0B4XA47_9HYPH|nr:MULTISPECIES: hydrogenase accessory protein [Rhizobium]AJD43615.1 hydrogenase expression/formation protein hupG [Rhizobium gallicum bv. gallicum R602sp]NNH28768.1 hydrogenase accessory protein [Rhizobium sp. SEMIA 4085]TDW34111.1 hydrogenase-1 operon protein HyaE [Rhizobium azibense]
MPSYLVRAWSERMQLPVVDEASIDTFLAPAAGEAEHSILFFTGDPAQRPEADDVAVVLPELLQAFQGRLRGAIVLRAAEDKLKPRFNVVVMPSLVVTRGAQPLGVIGNIRDWSEYVEKIGNWLSPDAPVMVASGGPKVEITHAGKEIVR